MNINWIPAISVNIAVIVIIWLFRKLIIVRLTNSVRHEYDKKIERLRTDLRQNEERFKADLRIKEAQINALSSGVLSGLAYRQTALFDRQLEAIEQIWDVVISLSSAKIISATVATLKFDMAIKEAEKNPKFRDMFSMYGDDWKNIRTDKALKARPFISPLAWAYYCAYQAIIFHATIRLRMLQSGLDVPQIIDDEGVIKLIKLALPHQGGYIEKFGASVFHYLLEELENNLLLAFQLMLKGEELDKANLEKSAAIIKQSEEIMIKSSDSE